MKKLALFVLILALGTGAFAQAAKNTKPDALDGNWWKTANTDQRKGSVDGSSACLADRSQLPSTTSTPELMKAVDSYFANPKNSKQAWVLEAFPNLPKSPINPHGGNANDPHAGIAAKKAAPAKSTRKGPEFGMAYWTAASADQKLGFVLGYSTCKWSLKPDVDWSTNIREQIDGTFQVNPKSTEKLSEAIVRIARSKKHMT